MLRLAEQCLERAKSSFIGRRDEPATPISYTTPINLAALSLTTALAVSPGKIGKYIQPQILQCFSNDFFPKRVNLLSLLQFRHNHKSRLFTRGLNITPGLDSAKFSQRVEGRSSPSCPQKSSRVCRQWSRRIPGSELLSEKLGTKQSRDKKESSRNSHSVKQKDAFWLQYS